MHDGLEFWEKFVISMMPIGVLAIMLIGAWVGMKE